LYAQSKKDTTLLSLVCGELEIHRINSKGSDVENQEPTQFYPIIMYKTWHSGDWLAKTNRIGSTLDPLGKSFQRLIRNVKNELVDLDGFFG